MLIAQISDMHVRADGALACGRIDTATLLARAVEHLLSLTSRPDLVLATGDLVDAGDHAEYQRLRRLLEPLRPLPVYLVPGNHDDREALRSGFPDHAYLPATGPFLHYVIDTGALRLVVLDTLEPGRVGGRLCDERLDWLRARLDDAPARPTVIVMHHPPFSTGIDYMDDFGFEGADAMADIVARYATVEAVLAGHLHRRISVRWGATVVTTAPSTAHQVALDLQPGGPSGFTREPPACLLHLWRAGQGLVTHTSYIGDYGPVYPFRGSARRAG
jgi:3',5'-cyclic AMP phosphodiesterase CpdA